MITDGEKWHYTVLKSIKTEDRFVCPVKSLSRLFTGITSNHNGDFYYLNCLHSFRSNNALKNHEETCEDHDYCCIDVPDKKNNTLKYIEGVKSLKIPFVIYADIECYLIKKPPCQNNPNKSYTEKKLYMSHMDILLILFHHLIPKKINIAITEVKIALKSFVKSSERQL